MRGFAGADRFDLGPRNDFDVHFGHFAEAQDRIFAPGVAGDAFAIEAHALLQHPARGLDRAALDLVDHAIRIDGVADIDRDRQPPDRNILGALDLGDGGAIGARILVAREADAVTNAVASFAFPAGAPRNRADHVLRPRGRQV